MDVRFEVAATVSPASAPTVTLSVVVPVAVPSCAFAGKAVNATVVASNIEVMRNFLTICFILIQQMGVVDPLSVLHGIVLLLLGLNRESLVPIGGETDSA